MRMEAGGCALVEGGLRGGSKAGGKQGWGLLLLQALRGRLRVPGGRGRQSGSALCPQNERVLFHYNGHGVPRPTVNGEIWVFNKSYTQYIPLSIYDLQARAGHALHALCIACNMALCGWLHVC